MSEKRRHKVTTIESHEYWVVRRPETARAKIQCQACPGAPDMLTPQEAAEQAGVSQRTVFRWIDEGSVHFADTTEGLFVCLAPLTTDVE